MTNRQHNSSDSFPRTETKAGSEFNHRQCLRPCTSSWACWTTSIKATTVSRFSRMGATPDSSKWTGPECCRFLLKFSQLQPNRRRMPCESRPCFVTMAATPRQQLAIVHRTATQDQRLRRDRPSGSSSFTPDYVRPEISYAPQSTPARSKRKYRREGGIWAVPQPV